MEGKNVKMKRLLVVCTAIFMSCAGTPSQKPSVMQKSSELLVSESQGGADLPGFTVIKNEQEYQKAASVETHCIANA